jgi:hypothetical protein
MPKVPFEVARQIANMLKVPVEMVWKIVKNMKTSDMKKLIDAVRKALRL